MKNKKIKLLKCINCGAECKLAKKNYNCIKCNSNLEIEFNYSFIKKNISKKKLKENNDFSIWRYEPLLPINNLKNIPNLQIGWTPIYKSKILEKKLGIKNLYFKDDGRNPSASFKDRASSIAIVNALENREKILCGASTGNAASSTACLSASLGIKSIIFVPKTAPIAKIAQLLVFGAKVIMVDGTYDDAFDLSIEASNKYNWYNRNTGYNPFTREGKKTWSFETAEQLNWTVPDKIFIPVGDGNILSGIWKGWKDLFKLGFIKKLPKLIAVQARYSNSIQKSFDTNKKISFVSGKTIADSISVSLPRDGLSAVNAIKESKGFALTVTDKEILSAISEVARGASIFGEPAGVTPYAGLKKAIKLNKVNTNDKIVIAVTGNGLKDINSAIKSVGKPFLIKPDIKELKKIINKI